MEKTLWLRYNYFIIICGELHSIIFFSNGGVYDYLVFPLDIKLISIKSISVTFITQRPNSYAYSCYKLS